MSPKSTAPQKSDEQKDMYTINEAAAFLGIPAETARTRRRNRRFPKPDAKTENGWDLWKLSSLREHLISFGK